MVGVNRDETSDGMDGRVAAAQALVLDVIKRRDAGDVNGALALAEEFLAGYGQESGAEFVA